MTQTPKDVPGDVLAQIGSRVQHQLRVHTPDDAKALRATVSTYPVSDYDLGEVLTSLGIDEAIVTVMNEKGAPTPVAWTRPRAPQGSMAPTPAERIRAAVAASPLQAKYGTAIDPESAREILGRKLEAAAQSAAAAAQAETAQKSQTEYEKMQRDWARSQPKAAPPRNPTPRRTQTSREKSPIDEILGSSIGRSVVREVVKGIFGTLRRR